MKGRIRANVELYSMTAGPAAPVQPNCGIEWHIADLPEGHPKMFTILPAGLADAEKLIVSL